MAVSPTMRVFFGQTDSIKNCTMKEFKVNGKNINDKSNWSFTDADFKKAVEADWTTEP